MNASSKADAMMLAAIHPCGQEQPLEISRNKVDSVVRDLSHFEEHTLDDLPIEKSGGRVHRELDLMRSFLVHQAVPQAQLTGKVWSTRCCCRRRGLQASETALCGEAVCNFWTQISESPTPGLEVTRDLVSDGSVE